MDAETAPVAAHSNSTDTEPVDEDPDRNLLRVRTTNLTPIEQEAPSITIERTVANLLLNTAPLPAHGASIDVDTLSEPLVADSSSRAAEPEPSFNAGTNPSLVDTGATNGPQGETTGLESVSSDVQPEINPVNLPDQTSTKPVDVEPNTVTDASGSTANRDVTETVTAEPDDDTISIVVEFADPSTSASNPDPQTQNDKVDSAEAQKIDSQQPTTQDVGAELGTTEDNTDSDPFANPFDDPFSAADDDQPSLDAAKQTSPTGKATGQPDKEDDVAQSQPLGAEQATSQKDDAIQSTITSETPPTPVPDVELSKKDEKTAPGSGAPAGTQPSKDTPPAQPLNAEPPILQRGDDTTQSTDTPKDTSSSVLDVESKLEASRPSEPPGELDLADTETKSLQGDTAFRRRRDTGTSEAGSFVSALDFFIPSDGDDEAEVDVTEMSDPEDDDGMNAETAHQPDTTPSGVGEAEQAGSWFSLSFQRAWDRFSRNEESKDATGGTDATGGAVDLPPRPEEISIIDVIPDPRQGGSSTITTVPKDDIDDTEATSITKVGQVPVFGASNAGGSTLEMQPDAIVTGLDKVVPDKVESTSVGEGSIVANVIPQASEAAVNAADKDIVDAKEEGNGPAATILLDSSGEPLKTDELAALSTSTDETGQKDSAMAKSASTDSSQAPAAETTESTNPDQQPSGDGMPSTSGAEDSKGDVGDNITPLGPQVADTVGSSVPQDTSAPPKVEESENPSASSEPLADGSKGEVIANPAPPTSTQQQLQPLDTSNSNNSAAPSKLPAGPESKVGESTNDAASSNTQQLLDALDMNVFNDEISPSIFRSE